MVHWLYWILGVIGVIMLQLSHGHYTVDVIIAYYVTTRIFWIYHTLANNANLKVSHMSQILMVANDLIDSTAVFNSVASI